LSVHEKRTGTWGVGGKSMEVQTIWKNQSKEKTREEHLKGTNHGERRAQKTGLVPRVASDLGGPRVASRGANVRRTK